jgi:hypothetical protein
MDCKRWWIMTRRRTLILIITVVLGGGCLLFPLISYRVADYEYEKLVQLKPDTKDAVERILFLCSIKQIDIKNSLWGKHYQIESGDVCFQYLILGREPIDIVFNRENHVTAIFSSFE